MLQLIYLTLITRIEGMSYHRHENQAGIETTEVAVIAGVVVALAIALGVILTHFVMSNVSGLSSSSGGT
jgi:hypothetical protein